MVQWDEKFSVKIQKIDDQHKTFFELINKLEEITQQEDFAESLPIVLNEIVEYASLHFKTEEKLLKEVGYPRTEVHHNMHEAIKKDMYHECSRVAEKEVTAMDIIWLYNYMMDWMKSHIIEEDLLYVSSLKQYHDC